MNVKTYEAFVNKFKHVKATDECYTPPAVYEAVKDYVDKYIYSLTGKKVVRPFYPGGNYVKHAEDYDEDTIVIDNPPFSSHAEIKRFYIEKGIKFFLFAPFLSLFSSNQDYCHIVTDINIIYENGARVATSFVTNLIEGVVIKSAPELVCMVKTAQQKTNRSLPVYDYPKNLIRPTTIAQLSRAGVSIEIEKKHTHFTRQLDHQKRYKKELFGGGFLVSDKVVKELEETTTQAKPGKEQVTWELSDREKEIIKNLG